MNVIRLALRFMCKASSLTKVELFVFAGSCVRFQADALELECGDSHNGFLMVHLKQMHISVIDLGEKHSLEIAVRPICHQV